MNPPFTIVRLLDTDIVIDIQRKHPPASIWYTGMPPGSIGLPGYVVMELYQQAQNKRQLRDVDVLVSAMPIIWPAEVECRRALSDFRQLHLSHGVGLIDTLVGHFLCPWPIR